MLGRERELAAIAAFLEEPPPTALVIAGAAGTGKSTLLAAATQLAEGRGARVLATSPGERETELPLAALADLLGPVAPEVADALPAPQRQAIDAVLLRVDPTAVAVEARVVAAATHGVLRAAATTSPLLVAIDDWQWLDPASEAALRFALRRLSGAPVHAVAGLRREGEGPGPDIGPPERMLVVAPLEAAVVEEIVRRELTRPLPPPAVHSIARLAGGNPFLAGELTRAAERHGVEAVVGRGAPPPDVTGLVRDRLAALPDETRAALGVVAAAGRSARRALETLVDPDALDAAFELDVVEEAGGDLRFTHPLLRAAAYAALSPPRRRRLHAALSELSESAEERAMHVAATSDASDAAAAAIVEEGARQARRRGAPTVAAALFEAAAQRTPRDDTPARSERLLAAGRAHADAGDIARGVALSRDTLADLVPGPLRARAMCQLATFETLTIDECVALALEALDQCGDDPGLRARCMLCASNALFVLPDHGRARALAFEALDLADRSGDRELRIWARASAGELALDESERSARSLLAEAVELEQDGPLTPSAEGCASATLGRMLTFRDQVEEARQLLERTIARARAEGDERGAAGLAIHLAEADVRAGRIADARAVVDEALSFAQLEIDDQLVGALLYARALGAAHAGDEEAARTAAAGGLAMLERLGDALFPLQLRAVLGFLEMSRGDAAAALEHLEDLPAAVDAVGRGAWQPIVCHAETIEALIGIGRSDEARDLLAAWEARGDGSPRVAATAARAHALLAAQEGDLDAALAELDAALEHHEGLPVPLERARTLIVRGIVLRRAGRRRDARAALEEARKICEAIGARLWATRCDTELARLGGRAPSRDALTPTEKRVAELVVAGRTNREVADALFVTVRTVEANLTRIYAKLGVRSRTELAALAATR